MGLAPWAGKHRNDMKNWYFPPKNDQQNTGSKVGLGDNFYHTHDFMSGNPFDGSFKVENKSDYCSSKFDFVFL